MVRDRPQTIADLVGRCLVARIEEQPGFREALLAQPLPWVAAIIREALGDELPAEVARLARSIDVESGLRSGRWHCGSAACEVESRAHAYEVAIDARMIELETGPIVR